MRLKIHTMHYKLAITMTTVHGSLSISTYDKSAQIEAQLKLKLEIMNL